MNDGTVKFYSLIQGIGFIKSDDGGPDVFVSQATLGNCGLNSLNDGQRVRYKLSSKALQPTACELQLIGDHLHPKRGLN